MRQPSTTRARIPRNARLREAHVVGRVVAVGDLNKAKATAALSQPLGLVGADKQVGCRA
jgi:hypothetical protein